MTAIAPDAALADGRYVVEELLGTGGMAAVWKARDTRLAREVAIKVISDTLAADRSYLRRFSREAKIAAGLGHPNLVRIYDYNAAGGRPFLIMEYVPGGTLADRFRAGDLGGLDPVEVARDVLGALAEIHRVGIVHRDVKPANVLIDADGRARLTDFGIAHSGDTTNLTTTGMVVGTRRYIAPEILAGEPPTPLTDLYSCGVLLGELSAHAPASEVGALATLLTREDPAERPQSADDALALLGAGPRLTAHAGGLDRSPVEIDRGTLIAGALAALLLAIAIGWFSLAGDERPATTSAVTEVDQRLDELDAAIRSAAR